jgi:hypothetical protein
MRALDVVGSGRRRLEELGGCRTSGEPTMTFDDHSLT